MTHSTGPLQRKISELEKEEILLALKECNWVMAKAARKLGITERMIGYKIRKYGLRIREVRWVETDFSVQQEGEITERTPKTDGEREKK